MNQDLPWNIPGCPGDLGSQGLQGPFMAPRLLSVRVGPWVSFYCAFSLGLGARVPWLTLGPWGSRAPWVPVPGLVFFHCVLVAVPPLYPPWFRVLIGTPTLF